MEGYGMVTAQSVWAAMKVDRHHFLHHVGENHNRIYPTLGWVIRQDM